MFIRVSDVVNPEEVIQVSDLTLEIRVMAGIARLNQSFPTWLQHVNLETLDILDSQNCILGQLWGVYTQGCKAMNLTSVKKRIKLGFTSEHWEIGPRLTQVWKDNIQQLRNRTVAEG